LCEAVGDPGLVARFASSPQEAKAALANALASRTQAEWQAIFSGVDACVEPVLSVREAADSELAKARGWQVSVPLGDASVEQPALPIKFSRFTPAYERAGGAVGEDNEAVLPHKE
ncbi:MAG: CoA transferase, partial [Burkholderiales bacterium]|nr:CoA transferase [Burkholderiales bacterium]